MRKQILLFYTALMCAAFSHAQQSATSKPLARNKLSALKRNIDIQAHQGGCGLYPCNTIPAFINAVKLGVTTLELDCVITKDKKVVVSHDQFMSHTMLTPAGGKISKEEELQYNIYTMLYDSVRRYDAGSAFNAEFQDQKKMKTYKPLLSEVIDSVEIFIRKNRFKPVQYNIEIKSRRGDGIYHPAPSEFVDLVMEALIKKGVQKKIMIQSFDIRALQRVHQYYPSFRISYLVNKSQQNLQKNLELLGFVPTIYSPEYTIVSAAMVTEAHRAGMKIIPWTIDKEADMIGVMKMGIDGIITNYPDFALKLKLQNGGW